MDLGPDRVLGPARAGRVDRAALDLVALRGLPPAGPVDRVELTDLVVQVVRADLHLADPVELGPVDLVHQHLAVRVAPADTHPVGLVVPAELDPVSPVVRPDLTVVPVDLGLVAPVELGPAGLVDLNPVGLVDTDLTVRVVPVDLDRVDLAGPAVRVDLVAPDLMDPVDRVDPVDRRRRRMCSMAPSTAVARNSAVRETRRTASAHPIMVLRRRPRSVGSAGTTGLLLGIRRRTGMDRRLPVAGTVRRLPVAGTRHGTVPAAT
jgi:hypothetical protein